MRTWIKLSLLIVAAVALSWGGAVWYWSATNRMPATTELVLYLIVLPIGLLLAFWAARKLLAAAPAALASSASASAPAGPAAATPAPAAVAAPLALLDVSLRTPHGAGAEQLSTAILDKKARPDLDPELLDDHGFPVMSSRSDDAADENLTAEIAAWFKARGIADPALMEEQWRTLALATAVAGELASSAAGQLLPQEGEPPLLHLVTILPADWTLEQRRACDLWLQHTASEAGWPLARIALPAALPANARGVAPSAVLARLAHQAMLSGLPLVGMVVAAASHIGETSVDKWGANDTLFTPSRPQGLVPGEGAAGLLVTDLRQAQALDGASFAVLDLEADERRHNSADEARKVDAKLLGTMVAKVLAKGAAAPDSVAMLVADTGHRTSRVLELMELAGAALPHLDADAEVLPTGAACGTCGAVPFVTTLALGRHHAIELEAPVLCISNEDPYRRSAVLVRPAAALS